MSFPLFRYDLRRLFRLWLLIAVLTAAYAYAVLRMYDGSPRILAASDSVQRMLLFGFVSGSNAYTAFVINDLYSLTLFLLPAAFSLLAAQQLMVRLVENRSMSWLLASPNSRTRIVWTQALALLVSLALLMAAGCAITVGLSEWLYPGQLDIMAYMLLTAEFFALQVCIAGVGFLFSCLCAESARALLGSCCICLIFYGITLVSNLGSQFSVLRYATVFSLVQPERILRLERTACLLPLIAALIGLVLLALSAWRFQKRNLHL